MGGFGSVLFRGGTAERAVVLKVNVAVTAPVLGDTAEGENEQDPPCGTPLLQLSKTGCVKPLEGVTVTV